MNSQEERIKELLAMNLSSVQAQTIVDLEDEAIREGWMIEPEPLKEVA